MQSAFGNLLVEIFKLARLNFVLALGGIELGNRLGDFRDGDAPGLVKFADGFRVFRKKFFGGFQKIIFEEQVAGSFGRDDFKPAVLESDVVLLQFGFRDKSLLEQAACALEPGFCLLEFFLSNLEIVIEFAQLLFGFTVPQNIEIGVFGEINRNRFEHFGIRYRGGFGRERRSQGCRGLSYRLRWEWRGWGLDRSFLRGRLFQA